MAEFYKGFVFECDVSALLTIEGNPVCVKRGPAGRAFTVKLPSRETFTIDDPASVSTVACRYIIRSGDLARRNMVTEKHLQKLRKGRAEWNRWRRENPDIKPVLANREVTVLCPYRPLGGPRRPADQVVHRTRGRAACERKSAGFTLRPNYSSLHLGGRACQAGN
jgi:hypothetical protein